MAGSTFLGLTNKLLRRLNAVELTETNFASAKGEPAMAKDAIIASVAEINTREFQWSWNKQTGSASASPGTQLFTFPNANAVPNWDTFRIVGTIDVGSNQLSPISEEEWYKYYRKIDVDGGSLRAPTFVFPTTGGFGVSPMPDQTYNIQYEYYSIPDEMFEYDDECVIPNVWDYVIINMALKHFYMYKDNTEQAGFWVSQAEGSFKTMRNSLVNRPDAVWSTVVNHGGQNWSVDYAKV